MADLEYSKDMKNIEKLENSLMELSSEESKNIRPGSVKSWFSSFKDFANSLSPSRDIPNNKSYAEQDFRSDLSAFRASPSGMPYADMFWLKDSKVDFLYVEN